MVSSPHSPRVALFSFILFSFVLQFLMPDNTPPPLQRAWLRFPQSVELVKYYLLLQLRQTARARKPGSDILVHHMVQEFTNPVDARKERETLSNWRTGRHSDILLDKDSR